MGSQEEVADVDNDSLNGSDGEVDVMDNVVKAITGETQKRRMGRLATTKEHVGKRKKEE